MWRLLVALLGLACTYAKHSSRCFSTEELQEGQVPVPLRAWTSRWHHLNSLNLLPHLENKHHSHSCPTLTAKALRPSNINKRSISPWEYYIDEEEDRFPRKLAVAKCLCKGCIQTSDGQESVSLNSVPVYQSMVVFRRKPCVRSDSTPGVQFEESYINVPVACTCVIPQYSS